MDRSAERGARQDALRDVEARLLAAPDSVSLLFARAQLLDALGENDAARQAYVDLLRRDATHEEGLTALAVLLNKTGNRSAAITTLLQVVNAHPEKSSAHANYATFLAEAENLAAAKVHYEHALRLDPNNSYAHRGFSIVLLRLGDEKEARLHAMLAGSAADVWPFRGEGAPVSLLLLWSARGGNVVIEPFIDDRIFQKTTLAVELWNADNELPDHDIVFNGIGDVDASGDALAVAERVLARTHRRVINLPSRVRASGRAANSIRLSRIPGVTMARTELWTRETLRSPGAAGALTNAGFSWPLLIRSPGFHAGAHFELVPSPSDLPDMLAKVPGEELLVLEFVDVRGDDGKFRKYRVMTVDGALYPLHLAISTRWKIHFFSADMSESQAHRDEDRRFLEDMPGVLGESVMLRLEQIRDMLGLDYGGIDFALDKAGRVVVFESNATMTILSPPANPIWAYRRAPVERVSAAVRAMLLGAQKRDGATA